MSITLFAEFFSLMWLAYFILGRVLDFIIASGIVRATLSQVSSAKARCKPWTYWLSSVCILYVIWYKWGFTL